jgi:hypothetical protein
LYIGFVEQEIYVCLISFDDGGCGKKGKNFLGKLTPVKETENCKTHIRVKRQGVILLLVVLDKVGREQVASVPFGCK